MKSYAIIAAAALVIAPLAFAGQPEAAAKGDYAEARSCDVYTGPCFANGEMGLTGTEAVMAWHVREGAWNGVSVAGLSVIAVVHTEETLGYKVDDQYDGRALIIVDEAADADQRAALRAMVIAKTDGVIGSIVKEIASPITAKIGACEGSGCAYVEAPGLVELNTRCLGEGDHICNNERVFYPPLTEVQGAIPAFSEIAKFDAEGLGATWEVSGGRNAFLATFGG